MSVDEKLIAFANRLADASGAVIRSWQSRLFSVAFLLYHLLYREETPFNNMSKSLKDFFQQVRCFK